jgi:hypothetical protein
MNSYMPQDTFNINAVTAANYIDHDSVKIEDFAKLISDASRRRFVDDGFEEDIINAAYNIVKMMETASSGKKASSALLQIQYCISNFHPNGKKIILKGAIFNKQKTPLPSRVSQCLADVTTFYLGTLAGTFPIAPKGWSLLRGDSIIEGMLARQNTGAMDKDRYGSVLNRTG